MAAKRGSKQLLRQGSAGLLNNQGCNCWNRERINTYLVVIFSCTLLVIYISLTMSSWTTPGRSTPLGEDFSIFWTASDLALAGKATATYDLSRFQSAQQELIGGKTPPNCGWYYPPTFLLMILPLALLPYKVSLAFWLIITIFGYSLVLRRLAPHPFTLWLGLSFPGAFWNFYYGQNGFLSATLLGGGLLLLDRSPILAGLLLGSMSYKPQLAFLIPVALIAGKRWKTLIVAAIWALLLAVASTFLFGVEVWKDFWVAILLHRTLFETGNLISYKFVPTFFASALLAGFRPPTAYAIQGLVMVGVVVSLAWVWSKGTSLAVSGSTLILAILLFPHFCCLYDLTLLALPLAWLAWEGFNKGWLFGEKFILTLAWLAPLSKFFLNQTNLQVVPLVLAILLIATLRRHYWELANIGSN